MSTNESAAQLTMREYYRRFLHDDYNYKKYKNERSGVSDLDIREDEIPLATDIPQEIKEAALTSSMKTLDTPEKIEYLLSYVVHTELANNINLNQLKDSLFIDMLRIIDTDRYLRLFANYILGILSKDSVTQDEQRDMLDILDLLMETTKPIDVINNTKIEYNKAKTLIYNYFGKYRVPFDKFHKYNFVLNAIFMGKNDFINHHKKYGMRLADIKKLSKNDYGHFGFTRENYYIANIGILNPYCRGQEIIINLCGSELNKKCIILDNWDDIPMMIKESINLKRRDIDASVSDLLALKYAHRRDAEYSRLLAIKREILYK